MHCRDRSDTGILLCLWVVRCELVVVMRLEEWWGSDERWCRVWPKLISTTFRSDVLAALLFLRYFIACRPEWYNKNCTLLRFCGHYVVIWVKILVSCDGDDEMMMSVECVSRIVKTLYSSISIQLKRYYHSSQFSHQGVLWCHNHPSKTPCGKCTRIGPRKLHLLHEIQWL